MGRRLVGRQPQRHKDTKTHGFFLVFFVQSQGWRNSKHKVFVRLRVFVSL